MGGGAAAGLTLAALLTMMSSVIKAPTDVALTPPRGLTENATPTKDGAAARRNDAQTNGADLRRELDRALAGQPVEKLPEAPKAPQSPKALGVDDLEFALSDRQSPVQRFTTGARAPVGGKDVRPEETLAALSPDAYKQAVEKLPAWRRNAADAAPVGNAPVLSIVIDDIGQNPTALKALMALGLPLTYSLLPESPNAANIAKQIRQGGHELLLHLPMEPLNKDHNPGPNAITMDLHDEEIARRVRWQLAQFDGYVGVNNHMGSAVTQNERIMTSVMRELRQAGLLFLDSRTTDKSLAGSVARRMQIPAADNDLFIDNERNVAAIMEKLRVAEKRAERWRVGVVIGHPHPETIEALRRWSAERAADPKGRPTTVAPLTVAVKRQMAQGL